MPRTNGFLHYHLKKVYLITYIRSNHQVTVDSVIDNLLPARAIFSVYKAKVHRGNETLYLFKFRYELVEFIEETWN